MPNNILKCFAGLSDGMIITCDGIEHEGKLWLVPAWKRDSKNQVAMPERIIRFDTFHYQAGEDALDYEYIRLPIPESALLGEMPSDIEYVDHPQNLFVPLHLLRRQ